MLSLQRRCPESRFYSDKLRRLYLCYDKVFPTLHDLRKVEGSVRLSCMSCGHVEERDRELLIAYRAGANRSCEWPVVQRDVKCRACGRGVRVDGVPFGEKSAGVRRDRAIAKLIDLALVILGDAAPTGKCTPDKLPAVRLALRVLAPFVRDREVLETYWRGVTVDKSVAWGGGHQCLRWIIAHLQANGFWVSSY